MKTLAEIWNHPLGTRKPPYEALWYSCDEPTEPLTELAVMDAEDGWFRVVLKGHWSNALYRVLIDTSHAHPWAWEKEA